MASQASRDFEKALSIAEALLKAESRYRDPPSTRVLKLVQGLRGGAAVLMVAAFEEFLRSAVREHLAPLARNPPPVQFDRLPEPLRLESVFGSMEFATKGPLRGQKKGRIHRLPEVRRAAQIIVQEIIDVETLCRVSGNASAETVTGMLKNLGIADVLTKMQLDFEAEWGSSVAHTFIRDKLDEIINRRHVVAHTAQVLNLTRSDLAESVQFLRILGSLIDRRLSDQVTQLLVL